jgi:SAM-dependent methyltransferase
MEINEYQTMYLVEDNYWWYVGLRKLIFDCIAGMNDNLKIKILDAGCGTGRILENLANFKAFGIDLSEEALKFCKLRNLNDLSRASICDLPFHANSFDVVISLDVISHVDVSYDNKILREIHRVINPGGVLLLNLPAYDFLKSTHDRAVHIKHRYLLSEIKKKVEDAGYVIETISYRNSFLLPIAFLVRIIKKISGRQDVKSDLKPLPEFLNRLLTKIIFLENCLIMRGMRFPFGLSIFCAAIKRNCIAQDSFQT